MIYNGKLYKRGKWINEQYIPDNEFDISRNQSETPSQNRVFSSYPSFEEDGQKKIVCKNGSVSENCFKEGLMDLEQCIISMVHSMKENG